MNWTCRDCEKIIIGHKLEHCSECHETFTCTRAGDLHRAGQLCKKLTIGSKASWGRVLSRVRSYGKGLEGIAKAMRCEPPLFAIAYLTARMRDDPIDPSEVELILHESGWVN